MGIGVGSGDDRGNKLGVRWRWRVGEEEFGADDEAAERLPRIGIAGARRSASAADEDRASAVGGAADERSRVQKISLMKNPGGGRASGRRAGFPRGP